MNFRKNSILIIGCSIAGILLIAAIFFLVKNQSDFRANTKALNASWNRLNQLNTRDPFPSLENVATAQANIDFIKQKFQSVYQAQLKEQLQIQTIEPARFAPLLEQSARHVFSMAKESGVIIPPALGLGFKAYTEGKLPPNNPATMERLVLQVKAVEDLCAIIVDAKVQSIDSILREEFELSADAGQQQDNVRERGRPTARAAQSSNTANTLGGIPAAPTNSMYTTERFIISMTGWESSIWEVLNQLASRKVAYVLVDAAFENTKLDIGKPVDMQAKLASMTAVSRAVPASVAGGQGQGAGALPDPMLSSISREDRIVGGREPIKAKIIVDMYRFKEEPAAEVQP